MSELGSSIVAEARRWCGTPVRWEASLRGVGCDCRGLVAGVARALGLPEGDRFEATVKGYAGRISEAALLAGLDGVFVRRPAGSEPAAGDVLALRLGRTVQHLAIASGGGTMIHAYMGTPALVCEVPLDRFWRKRLAGVWAWRHDEGCISPCPAAPLLEGAPSGRPNAPLLEGNRDAGS